MNCDITSHVVVNSFTTTHFVIYFVTICMCQFVIGSMHYLHTSQSLVLNEK